MRSPQGSDWGQEGGASAAASMLRRYDAVTGRWELERTGEFWEAVGSARELGRRGDGHTIAVIDDGFDMTLPALAEHELAWTVEGAGRADHGTVVALLIHEVAPGARLLLYPTAIRGVWDAQLIERALLEVVSTPTTIVNLSLGKAFPAEAVFRAREFIESAEPWEDMSLADLDFWVADRFGELNGWRELLRVPHTGIGDAAAAVAQTGRTVIAAAGNARRHAFSPALEPDVFSVGFFRSRRTTNAGLQEDAVAVSPTFSQSDFTDFSVIQPPHALGSSFATPLITGLSALLRSRGDLFAYRDAVRLAALAAQVFAKLDDRADGWSDRRDGVVDRLFVKALHSQPHPHLSPDHYEVCPECAYFAADAYVNFGLFKLNWNDLDGAEQLLRSATTFAPANPHAAANLGMVYAARAERASGDGKWSDVATLLVEAARLQTRAAVLRPDHPPYRSRAAEFLAGAKDPREWKMDP